MGFYPARTWTLNLNESKKWNRRVSQPCLFRWIRSLAIDGLQDCIEVLLLALSGSGVPP
jgi:hypothetical protein